MYEIMCFYRSKKNSLCKLFLGVPETTKHFGTAIAGEILGLLHAFNIGSEKIGYFTLDNAETTPQP
jgi:hypothetical protein